MVPYIRVYAVRRLGDWGVTNISRIFDLFIAFFLLDYIVGLGIYTTWYDENIVKRIESNIENIFMRNKIAKYDVQRKISQAISCSSVM